MPDLRQALRDFVATSNSGKYSDEKVLLSKFPELKGYDIQALRDFVATSNSGKYETEDELFSKFPEFNIGVNPVKKKFALESSSEDGSLESKKSIKPLSDMPTLDQQGLEKAMAKRQSVPTDMSGTPIVDTKAQKAAKPIIEKISKNKPELIKPKVLKEQEEKESYLENVGTNIIAGVNDVDKMLTSIPETLYNLFSIPQNAVAYFSGLDISTSADKFKKNVGISNPILDYYKEEGKKLEKEITDFNKDRYESSSIYENIQNGNYGDAFELLGSGIARSAPTSIAMMAGGATMSTAELATVSTAAFYDQNLEQIQEENPNASEIENNIKALGMAAAESVFSSIGEGQIGAVYKDIIKREGVEVGQKVFKDGLIQMYKGALEKYGVPVGLLGEGIEESATQITQNMISGKPAFEGAADAFILGGGSGVMFTAPISLKNAKDKIKNKIIEVDDKKKINTILADSNETFNKVFDVPKDSEINEKQLSIASLDKSRDLLVKDLKVSVKKGDMTEDQAKQSLYVFDKTQQITGQLRGIDIDEKSKVKVANLLKERETLSDKMNGKDPALSILEKQRIDEINKEIQDTILKSKENAVQEQSTTEIPVQSETGVSETMEVGTPEAKPEIVTEQVTQGEVTAPQTIIEEPTTPISEALNDVSGVYVYDGKKGQLTTIGQTVVLETPTEIIDLGNVDELSDSTLADFGIQKEEELDITLNEDNSISVSGKIYLNNYSNPDAAINQDKDGNYSVTLDTEDGQKRTFRGQQADQIVYQMKLKNFEQNGTDEQIEQANELADEVIRTEEEVREPSTEREGKTVRKGKRKQRTLKTVKEPLTKAERTAKATPAPVVEEARKDSIPAVWEGIDEKGNKVWHTYDPVEGDTFYSDTKEEAMETWEGVWNNVTKEQREQMWMNDSTQSELDPVIQATTARTKSEVAPKAKPAEVKGTKKVGDGVYQHNKTGKYIFKREGDISNSWNIFNDIDAIDEFAIGFNTKWQAVEYLDSLNKETAPETKAEVAAVEAKAEVATEAKDLLDLDTKDKDSLKRVFEYLDGIDKSLDMDPNELNDVTRVMAIGTAKLIVKTLKTLVNAGITLKEAIDKVAEIYSIKSSEIIDALDIASKINENVSEGISEMEAPGYNNLSKEIDNMISNDSSVSEVLDYVQSSDVYENATDVQKELLVRDVRKRFGLRQKSAPSVNKLFGKIKDVTKVTMSEKTALIKQIKDRAKGARESVQAWKKQSEEFAKELNDLVKAGKITNTQVGVILKRFSKVNIFSEKSMNRFTDYMVKVFNDSNYKNKLTKARDVLSSLKKLSKDQTKNADLRAVASEFIKIDPSFVENIDEYNDIANKLKTAVDGSKIRKSTTKFAETVNAEEVISYVEKTLVDQESKIREESIQELQDLLGVDASEFSAEEINALLESDKDISKDDEKIVRASIKKAFDIYSTVIKEMLSTGLDPFTEEDVTFTKEQKELIERFMKIDPNKITDAKEALRAVDSLVNFIQNKSTAGMLKSIAQYEGIEGGEQVVSEGLKATRLRKYWSPKLGLFLGQKLTTLPVLFDKMFKGVTRALRVEELIGMSDLINNSSKSESESNRIVKEYVNKFYKTEANGESFNSAYNDIERGVFAHIFRNVIGPESRMKEVFSKRKQEVLDTIDLLSKRGNESEQEIAKLLQKVYDKILDGSENIQDVIGKTDANNVKAVEHWVKEWSNKYDSLADLALNFYNKLLGRDLNYTPDKIKKLQDKMQDIDLEDVQSQFFANTDEILYDKKSGSLMDKQENRSIPKDMYVDFSFDKKNSNAMNDALADLYTAFDVAKVGSFLKSKEFRKVFPSAKDANLIDKRIKKFVRLTRKKTPFSNEDISNFLKAANKLAKLGVTASLASPSQPFKQTIPVMFSTAMSAGSLGFGIAFNTNFNNWLDDLGFAISNRGVESQAEIDSLNKLLEKAADMPLDKALKFIERTNDKALKVLLVNFDVWIARASFKAYYEQSLKKQGEKSSGIDYSKHEVNKEAANYAQRMVDRQQNISNPALAGDLFTSENTSTKTLVKMLMPFSSFRTNQSARLGADLSTLEYWNTSTKEDKVIALRSIAGYVLEAAAYRSLQIGFALLTYSAAKAIMGADDEEEDKKYVKNLLTGSGQSFMTDTFSPIPLSDPFMQDAMSFSAEEIQSLMDIPEEEKLKLFGSQEQSALKILGTYGIPLQKAKDIYSLGRLAYTQKYKDNYGKEKEISDEQADNLKKLIAPLFAASVMGVGSPDMTSIVNRSVKMSKKSDKIDMSLLKKTNPDMYERVKSYQDRGSNKEMGDRLKARKKELEDRIKNR